MSAFDLSDPHTRLKYFNFFMYGSWSLLNPFLPVYFQHTGFTALQIGVLMSVGPMISLFANPFWGYWSDRLQNPRLILLIMFAGNIATSQMYFYSQSFMLVFILMLLFYFFQTAINPISSSLTLQTIENTEYNFGTFRIWGSLGFAIMVLVSSPFFEIAGIDKLGLLYGAFILITFLFAFGLPKPRIRKSKGRSKTFSQVTQLFRNKLFVLFLILSIIMSIPNRINSNFIGVFISEMGGSEVYVGWSWFIAAIVEVPLFLLLDRYLKTTERTMFGLMTLVSLLFILRWFMMAAADTPLQAVLIQLLHGFTFGIMYYTGTQICNFLVPKPIQSSGMAIYGLCWMGIAGIISGVFGGMLLDWFDVRTMYEVCAMMSILGALGFLGLWWYYKQKETTTSV